MARPRRFALALLCAAAAIGGFEWSGVENPATPIWNRAGAGGASLASACARPGGPLAPRALTSAGAMTAAPSKVDTNKVTAQIKTTVKNKKGKTRTVTKTITNYVVADFGWKDPIAAQKVGMSLKDYVIGGMDRGFKLKLFRALRMMDDAGFMPGITSAFRDDYRQSIASGNKAASDSSFHAGSRRGGHGHGLAIDLARVKGETRLQRFAASEELWKWVDRHETQLGVGRPYLDRDPPHIGAIDGKEYAAKRGGRPPTARKVANGGSASGAKSTASTQPPARKIAKNEGASGAKSTASTQPPAQERKKAKRAIPTVSKAAGMVVHSSLQ